MAFNYSPLNKTATDLITKFGQAVTFSRYARGEYSPNTGAFSSNVGQTYTAQVVILNEPKTEEVWFSHRPSSPAGNCRDSEVTSEPRLRPRDASHGVRRSASGARIETIQTSLCHTVPRG